MPRLKGSKSFKGSFQEYDSICKSDVKMTTCDGIELSSDIYFPAIGGKAVKRKFPVILERTPYDKTASGQVAKGKYFARRGYVCAIQDVRGRFESEGEWYAFAKEAPDGYDAVEWFGSQEWSNGKVGTMGDSYAGSDQAALATLNPSHLTTMVVAVGASNYFHSSMRQNGALEQRFLIYAFRMAVTSKEAKADPALRAALQSIHPDNMAEIVNNFPLKKGSTILSELPSYEQWAIDILTSGDYDEYWKQRGYAPDEYYEEHADVPTLYLGGWYDSYARNTCDSYRKLSKIKKTPQHLLMGPWTHGAYEVTYAGDVDFGTESHVNYLDLKLAWFDHHMKDMYTEVADWSPVRIYTMGTGTGEPNDDGRLQQGGFWSQKPDWPIPETAFTPCYFHGDGSLSAEKPKNISEQVSTFTFDPTNPVPTIGGGISAGAPIMEPGAYDQTGGPKFFGSVEGLALNLRSDVLSFQTSPLVEDVNVTGPIEMHIWASSSALDTDFTAKLVDVHPKSTYYPRGLSINITDSIIRARYRNGYETPDLMKPGEIYEFVFQLYPTSNIFRKGHRIRVDVSSSNWPRFDINPNTGNTLGEHRGYQVAQQTIYHQSDYPSHIVLPIQKT